MDLGSMRFLKALLLAVFALQPYCCLAETAPNYSFVHESTTAPPVSYHDYIVVGGGAAGCPLAATLSETANVLVLERGGSPYRNPETEFVKESGLDEALVNDAYQWVENKVVFKAPLLQWQTAVRDGLLEAGVLPYNGFTNEHINGTKIGSTIFDMNDHRHSAADLLEYADPKNIIVYLHATVTKILFTTQTVGSRPRAIGVIYEDALRVKHMAYLTNDSKSEIIVSAGAIGSSQLLMLSGIGPRSQLEPLGIKLVMDQPMVGQGMADNTLNGLLIPSPNPVELSLVSAVGISLLVNYIEAGSGLNLAPSFGWISKFLLPILGQVFTCNFLHLHMCFFGGIIIQKVARPLSIGHLELRSTDPNETPKVRFNYFQEPEDLRNCVQGMKTIINVVNSKAFSKFRYRTISTQQLLTVVAALPLNQRPRHFDTASSLEQFCNDTVMTFWHHHGGCQVGKVVDKDYRVIGVDGLRVIDASTFSFTPGTNPQATVMMLGRAMGVRIEKDRRS
ncbi:protein HOTHEAD-like isoform X1 [Gossypium australe]|uniref:Protein HOTHEAD-like isoform X1 n=1 Tax=Gossypium australe TaxID=47621 RepID=A0A5B6UUM3_9ROSI|nr:protein HOTHEAD-like isoform X1 [Gossypium australe]